MGSQSNLTELPPINSPALDLSDQEQENDDIKRRGKAKIWNREQTFSSKKEAEEFVSNENCWKRSDKSNSSRGERVTFRCNQTPLKSENPCLASVYLLYSSESIEVILYRSSDEHDHSDSSTKIGIPIKVKEIIKEIYNDGTTAPIAILSALERRNVSKPSKQQLNNFLSSHRKEKYGPPTLNMNDLQKWCQQRESLPDNVDKPFVVSSVFNFDFDEDQQDFKIFISTRRLFQNCNKTDLLQTDATYKLNYHGYPLLLVGSSDKSQVFHPFGVALTFGESTADFTFIFEALKKGVQLSTGEEYQPKFLLADAAAAITKGFVNVFGAPVKRLMCFFHVKKNLDIKIRSFDKKDKAQVYSDLNALQCCDSDLSFDKAAELFIKKWSKSESHVVERFVQYFKSEWLESPYKYWYEGCSAHPSTNNGVEATNSVIKDSFTHRSRLPLSQFFSMIEERLLPYWSKQRNENETVDIKRFVVSQRISDDAWIGGYQWAHSNIKVLKEEEGETHFFYVPSSEFLKKNENTDRCFMKTDVDEYKNSMGAWETFEDFVSFRNSLWMVKMTNSDVNSISCNCPKFLKQLSCKHSVGVCVRMNLLLVPDKFKNVLIGRKRKRGRPAATKSALVFQ